MADRSLFIIQNAMVTILRNNNDGTVKMEINNGIRSIVLSFNDRVEENFSMFNEMAQKQSAIGVSFTPEK